jgi:hypothetical protein
MARIRSLLGDIEGSAGQITFSKQNGKNILRHKVAAAGRGGFAPWPDRATGSCIGEA